MRISYWPNLKSAAQNNYQDIWDRFATNFYRLPDLDLDLLGEIIGQPAQLFQEDAVYQIGRL